VKKKIRKWLYGKCPGFAGAFPYYGVKVYFPKNSLIFQLACEQSVYEHENIKMLLSLIKPDTVYFDIGANIGLMSIPVLRTLPNCRVVSFEPSPNALPFLLRTAEGSRYGDRWTIVGKATGNNIGETTFHISSIERGAFDSIKDTKRVDCDKEIIVPITTIDHEWEIREKPVVSVIKVDVEGSELQTLLGGLKCIAHEKPIILTEWNTVNLRAYDCAPEKLLEFAADIRYRAFSMPHLIPVTERVHLVTQMLITENFLLVPE